jgi:ribosomal protein S18 acetylase RimI-like enzyme
MGEAAPLAALLCLRPGPRQAFANCQSEHLPVVRRAFYLSHDQPLLRMKVTADAFRPPRGKARRLHGRDVRLVNRLYNTGGTAVSYTARHIEEGVFFGAYVGQRLVAVAGTHAVSPTHGVAVVGNVYTHPHYRGRGLGTLVTGVVTAAVIDACPLVVLSVDPSNRAAVRAYQRLGYVEDCRVIEAAATRKDVVGLGGLVRRLVAALRGRGTGGALVHL